MKYTVATGPPRLRNACLTREGHRAVKKGREKKKKEIKRKKERKKKKKEKEKKKGRVLSTLRRSYRNLQGHCLPTKIAGDS